MYAILVCGKSDEITYKDNADKNQEKSFSVLDDETEAFRWNNNDEQFTWKVYTTTNGFNPNRRCSDAASDTWDHLSFAFYFPDENQTLDLPPELFTIETKLASKYLPETRKTDSKKYRTNYEQTSDEEIVAKLNEKISRCNVERQIITPLSGLGIIPERAQAGSKSLP
uniref:Uncharacterized protein n=1 Tax=Panagrolaimus sp. PS1159 TaxID=55785 RepID=A0AC35FYB7_9BILA